MSEPASGSIACDVPAARTMACVASRRCLASPTRMVPAPRSAWMVTGTGALCAGSIVPFRSVIVTSFTAGSSLITRTSRGCPSPTTAGNSIGRAAGMSVAGTCAMAGACAVAGTCAVAVQSGERMPAITRTGNERLRVVIGVVLLRQGDAVSRRRRHSVTAGNVMQGRAQHGRAQHGASGQGRRSRFGAAALRALVSRADAAEHGDGEYQRKDADERGVGEERHVPCAEGFGRHARLLDRGREGLWRTVCEQTRERRECATVCHPSGVLDDAPRLRGEQPPRNRVQRREECVLRRGEARRRQTRHVGDETRACEAAGDVVEADRCEQRPQAVVLQREPDEQQVAERPGERPDDHRAQQTVACDRHPTREHAQHRHHDAEDLPHLGDLDQRVPEVEIEGIHDVEDEVGNAIETDERQHQRARPLVPREEVAQRIRQCRGEVHARARARCGQGRRGHRDRRESCEHRPEVHPDARIRLPGGEHRVARFNEAEPAEHLAEDRRVGREPGSEHERAGRQHRQSHYPLDRIAQRRGGNARRGDRPHGVLRLAWRGHHAHDPDDHQRRHHGVGQVPAVAAREQQRDGAGRDDGDAVSPLVRGGHRALARRLGHFDAPRIDGDVLRGRREADDGGAHRQGAEAIGRIEAGYEAEAEDDRRLAGEHPCAAMSQPGVEDGEAEPIDERRPEELEARDQRDEAEEADDLERESRRSQPCRQRVEDEEVRQPGREAEGDHDYRGSLGVDGERLPKRSLLAGVRGRGHGVARAASRSRLGSTWSDRAIAAAV